MLKYILRNSTRGIGHVIFYDFVLENLPLPTFFPEEYLLVYLEKLFWKFQSNLIPSLHKRQKQSPEMVNGILESKSLLDGCTVISYNFYIQPSP